MIIILEKLKEMMPKAKRKLADEVKALMENIENEQKVEASWKQLVKIYNHLLSPNCDYPHREILLKKITPFLAKYGDMSEIKDHRYLTK